MDRRKIMMQNMPRTVFDFKMGENAKKTKDVKNKSINYDTPHDQSQRASPDKISNHFILSKPAEMVDFDLLKSDRSADEAVLTAPDEPTMQDI